MGNFQVVKCQNCGAKNRVSLDSSRQAVCGKCKSALKLPTSPINLTDANFVSEAEVSNLPVLVDFWATWCPPCRLIAPIIEKLAEELAGKVVVGKIDVDQNPIISARFRVQSIPTLIVFKNGKEVDRIVGAQSKEAILQRLRSFI